MYKMHAYFEWFDTNAEKLFFLPDNEYNFILLDEKIHKLAPKQWKSGSGEVSLVYSPKKSV